MTARHPKEIAIDELVLSAAEVVKDPG